jgi:hypothetical protein
VTSLFFFREGDKVTEATYGREYQLQAKMDNPSGNVSCQPIIMTVSNWRKRARQKLVFGRKKMPKIV